MKELYSFITNNKAVLIGMVVGLIIGYIYWHYFACYWGTYALSAHCWVNCSFGVITGGFIASLIDNEHA
jgi:hypothetical protein